MQLLFVGTVGGRLALPLVLPPGGLSRRGPECG